jgi:hypothetical protein
MLFFRMRMISRIIELLILAVLIAVLNLSGPKGVPRWLVRGLSLVLLLIGIAAVCFQ